MNASRSNRYALTAVTLGALLAGCGGTQNAINVTPSSITQNIAHVSHKDKSGILPGTSSEDLLYVVTGQGGTEISVFDYTTGELVGTLTGFSSVVNICSDNQGDVYALTEGNTYDDNEIVEYAHGASTATRVTSLPNYYAPTSCSVDPDTADLAVATNYEHGRMPPTLFIYRKARGTPKSYVAAPTMTESASVTYAAKRDIVLLGYDTDVSSSYRYKAVFDLLARDGKVLHRLKVLHANRIHYVALGWDGTYLTALGYYLSRYQVHGQSLRRIDKILSNQVSNNYFCLVPKYGEIVISDDATNAVKTYDYPSGTYVREWSVNEPGGIAISLAPSRTRIR